MDSSENKYLLDIVTCVRIKKAFVLLKFIEALYIYCISTPGHL